MKLRKPLIFLVFFCTPATAAAEESTVDDDRFERCVYSRSIRSTDVLNDDYIVFRMVGGKNYLNQLPKSCRGLSRDRRFTYELSERRLCAGDRIRILMDAGNEMFEGRACKLGEFRRLTDVEFAEIYSPEPKKLERKPVSSPEVEEIDSQDAGQQEED